MLARDIMTRDVATVGPETPIDDVARILLIRHISGVPVVDREGTPIGVVSEWDLVGQHSADRIGRRDEWLAHLAQGLPLSTDFLKSVEPTSRSAGEIAHRVPITVPDDTDLADVAQLIIEQRIGRVFVTRDGRLVGVVSRRDLVRAHVVGDGGARPAEPVDRSLPAAPPIAPIVSVAATESGEEFSSDGAATSAAAFRRLVDEAAMAERLRREAVTHAQEEERHRRIADLAAAKLDDVQWRDLVERSRTAASHGERELLLLRFPSGLCSDRGRAINAPDPTWPTTLRGIAAEVFLRWEKELKPVGFGLTAQILDFPGGFPGDAGLTLRWGG